MISKVRALALAAWALLSWAAVSSASPPSIAASPWREAMASVTDLERTAAFFETIAGYQRLWSGRASEEDLRFWGLPEGAAAQVLLLRAPDRPHGFVRLVQFERAGPKPPARPGARPWDTGCFFSLMVRARDLDAVWADAVRLGWWSETPVTDLAFAGSQLKVVILQGPDGLQVQAYERLSPPLPEAFGAFERVSQPFNMMQMVRDREAARDFMEGVLGFGRFWYGAPHLESEPAFMPLGIPRNLTTSVPYKAGIFHPAPGEFGRLEVIEIEGLEGRDHAARCNAPNLGWLAVSYPVEDARAATEMVRARGGRLEAGPVRLVRPPFGLIEAFRLKTPDGANLEFFSEVAGK